MVRHELSVTVVRILGLGEREGKAGACFGKLPVDVVLGFAFLQEAKGFCKMIV